MKSLTLIDSIIQEECESDDTPTPKAALMLRRHLQENANFSGVDETCKGSAIAKLIGLGGSGSSFTHLRDETFTSMALRNRSQAKSSQDINPVPCHLPSLNVKSHLRKSTELRRTMGPVQQKASENAKLFAENNNY
jgi:hypothetical protein